MPSNINEQTEFEVTPGRLVSLGLQHENALEAFLSEFDGVSYELQGYFCGRSAPIEQAVGLLDAWTVSYTHLTLPTNREV